MKKISPISYNNIFQSNNTQDNYSKGNIMKKISPISYNNIFQSNNTQDNYSKGNIMNKINVSEEVSLDTVNMLNNNNVEWFFDDGAGSGKYGGSQGTLFRNFEQFMKDPVVLMIINRYYSNVTPDDMYFLFSRMKTSGCGYVAFVNTIMQYTSTMSDEEFIEKFGFPRSKIIHTYDAPITNYYDEGHKEEIIYYEYMFLDFFLSVAKNEFHYDTIEEVYGNAEDELERIERNSASNNNNLTFGIFEEKFKKTGMKGTYLDEVAKWARHYLLEKGIFLKTDYVEINRNNDPNTIIEYLDQGKMVIVSCSEFPIYYSYDKDGDGKLDDVDNKSVGSHAMLVTGFDEESGKLIVSSWGEKYLIDISSVKEYAIYDYDVNEGIGINKFVNMP